MGLSSRFPLSQNELCTSLEQLIAFYLFIKKKKWLKCRRNEMKNKMKKNIYKKYGKIQTPRLQHWRLRPDDLWAKGQNKSGIMSHFDIWYILISYVGKLYTSWTKNNEGSLKWLETTIGTSQMAASSWSPVSSDRWTKPLLCCHLVAYLVMRLRWNVAAEVMRPTVHCKCLIAKRWNDVHK